MHPILIVNAYLKCTSYLGFFLNSLGNELFGNYLIGIEYCVLHTKCGFPNKVRLDDLKIDKEEKEWAQEKIEKADPKQENLKS